MVLFNSLSMVSDNAAKPSAKWVGSVKSRVSPWLATLAYPLNCGVVIPGYFGAIDITGRNHLPTNGPVILAPTHRSRWDALLVAHAVGRHVTGRDLRFMVSANEMTGMQGWFIRRLGGFPVNPKQPAIASLRFGVDALHDQEMMVIFPEGGIFRDNSLHPLKPGLARLALQAELSKPGLGVRIVPIHISYGEPFPTWNCNVRIQIGEPLYVQPYCQSNGPEATKQNACQLTSHLASALQKLGDASSPDLGVSAIAS